MYFLPDDMLKFDMGINIWSRTGTKAQLCRGRGRAGEGERERERARERRSDSLCAYEAQTNRNLKQKIIDISAICNNDHADDVDCVAEFIA